MSNIDPPAGWDDVDGINTNERLLGGPSGPLNRGLVGLTARTKQLRADQAAQVLRAGNYVSLRSFATGDGVTDDSAGFDAFIAQVQTTGLIGFIPSGTYRIPNATKVVAAGPITLVGEGRGTSPTLDGGKTVPGQLFNLTAFPVSVTNVTFANMIDVFAAGDGSGGSMSPVLTGDVSLFALDSVTFRNCRRPTFFVVSKTGPVLARLRVADCDVDGASTGWCGLYLAWTNITAARVERNYIRNIDATTAGFTGAGTPQNIGNGRALLLGGNNPAVGYTMARWSVCDNVVENITDSRAKSAGVNPEVGGLRVTGARYVAICRNRIKNVASSGSGVDDDCEGIYPKCAYSVITDNILEDAGLNGGAIYVKGYDRDYTGQEPGDPSAEGFVGVVANNVIRRVTLGRACGISIYSSDWLVVNNYIENCGGDTSRYAAIWANAGKNDNTVIRGNTIKNATGYYGILVTSYGKNIRIEDNIVDGVLANLPGLAPGHVYGVYVLNANSSGYNTTSVPLADCSVARNLVGGLALMSGQQRRAISLSSGGSNAVRTRVTGNVLTDTCEVGIILSNGVFDALTINDNDLRTAATKYVTTGSPTVNELAASSNLGWLTGSVSINPPNLAPAASVEIGTVAIANAATRDLVRVTSSSGLSGLQLWGAVTATGVVSVYLFNPTAAAVDMPTSTFRVAVDKFVTA